MPRTIIPRLTQITLLFLASCSSHPSNRPTYLTCLLQSERFEYRDSATFHHAFWKFYRDTGNHFFILTFAIVPKQDKLIDTPVYNELPVSFDSATFEFDGTYLSDKDHVVKEIANSNGGIFPLITGLSDIKFLKDCPKWNGMGFGLLQGLDRSRKDSADNLGFAGFYDRPTPYEIIFLYHDSITVRNTKGKEISDDFFKGCSNKFIDFDCVAYELKMKNPDDLDDRNLSRYSFPTPVKVYKRITADFWTYLGQFEPPTYEAYRDLQFRTIYANSPTFAP